MPIIGTPELILILVILVFLFGATRLRGLAKGLGESVKEFRKATKEPTDKQEDADEDIIKAAEKMSIITEGKNIKQILREMEKKTK